MLRFLWFDDVKKDEPKIERFQFTRLVFGLTSSPAILASVIQHHLSLHKDEEPEIVSLLNDSFYVDDLAGGAKCDDDALNVYKGAQALMKNGGFTLRKWTSNSRTFREKIANIEREEKLSVGAKNDQLQDGADEILATTTTDAKSVKILGLNWDIESDEFHLDPNKLMKYAASLPPTKRSVLKLSAKIFDPIGILTPFTINMKCLFQILCINHIDWDKELHGEHLAVWKSMLKDSNVINSVCIPRCYFTGLSAIRKQQIHGFCDASKRAFAAVVYLRTEYESNHVEVNLISLKTRVASLRRQTIPRLELLGANILALLVNSVLKAISSLIGSLEVFLWTDSYTTLCWIKNNRVWKQYVQQRVKEIRNLTQQDQWNFCPGELNIADLPSRVCSGTALAQNEKWIHGPDFLKGPESQWPTSAHPTSLVNDIVLSEAVKDPPSPTRNLLASTNVPLSHATIGMVMGRSKYSSSTKLLRVTALILHFIKKLKRQEMQGKTAQDLTANDVKQAEILWIRHIQHDAFGEVIQRLTAKQGVPNQLISQLNLLLDENEIIRCEGRLQHSTLPADANKPILLPSRHHFSNLVIQDRHQTVHHGGIKDTLNCVRQICWVLRGRESVKRLLRKCVTCRKHEGKSFSTPKVPRLAHSGNWPSLRNLSLAMTV